RDCAEPRRCPSTWIAARSARSFRGTPQFIGGRHPPRICLVGDEGRPLSGRSEPDLVLAMHSPMLTLENSRRSAGLGMPSPATKFVVCRRGEACLARLVSVLLVLLFFVSANVFAQQPRAENFFPISVWYGGGKARAPMLERDPLSKVDAWRKDIAQIKKLGFNTVRCWIDWASGEPEEGRYQFQTIDVILKLAEEQGLKVIVQVYMDSAPSWVGRKYPDSLFVSSNGEAIHPESAPGYCVDNPG